MADAQTPSSPAPLPGGMTAWLTGLPSSGKSTLARGLAAKLAESGYDYQILDGDEIREQLSKGLGFSREDRDENVRRIGYVAHLLANHGTIAICPVISPYASTRRQVREFHAPNQFMEIYIATPVEICEDRDVKGLYAKARAGEITSMTGIDDPYEAPHNPELVIQAGMLSPDESAELIYTSLISRLA